MKSFLVRWLATTLAVALAVKITGMEAAGWPPVVLMALLLGVINAVVRPVLMLLSIPFIIVSLGLFILILNALLFWFASSLAGVHVDGFWQALFGSIIVSVVNWVFSAFTRTGDGHFQVVTHRGQLTTPREKEVQGRVIE